MAKVGVVLCGCGMHDGSEVHEATLSLLFLARAGADIVCMAPDVNQADVIDHVTAKPMAEKRSALLEAARIARGKITDIKMVKATDLDALVLPGGVGAAKTLSDFAANGANMTVNPEVARLVTEMHTAGKPMGFICIAPVIAAKVLGATVTIGSDRNVAAAIAQMGGKHVACRVDEIVLDEKNRVVSTPAYMLGEIISQVAPGIEKLVAGVLKLV